MGKVFWRNDRAPAEWRVSPGISDFEATVAAMEARAEAVAAGEAPELVHLVEWPALYTSPRPCGAMPLPIHKVGRGGEITFHGPGQRAIILVMALRERRADMPGFVRTVEDWIIATLAEFGIEAERRDGAPGVWVGSDKIAALGFKARRMVTSWGVSLNVAPDLSHYEPIVACGIADGGMTSMAALGVPVSMDAVDQVLRREFERLFGPTRGAQAQEDNP